MADPEPYMLTGMIQRVGRLAEAAAAAFEAGGFEYANPDISEGSHRPTVAELAIELYALLLMVDREHGGIAAGGRFELEWDEGADGEEDRVNIRLDLGSLPAPVFHWPTEFSLKDSLRRADME